MGGIKAEAQGHASFICPGLASAAQSGSGEAWLPRPLWPRPVLARSSIVIGGFRRRRPRRRCRGLLLALWCRQKALGLDGPIQSIVTTNYLPPTAHQTLGDVVAPEPNTRRGRAPRSAWRRRAPGAAAAAGACLFALSAFYMPPPLNQCTDVPMLTSCGITMLRTRQDTELARATSRRFDASRHGGGGRRKP